MVSPEELSKLVAQMRSLGVLHLEADGVKLTLTPEAPVPATEAEDEQDDTPPEPFLTVHDHPDTYGGFVPHIKREPRVTSE